MQRLANIFVLLLFLNTIDTIDTKNKRDLASKHVTCISGRGISVFNEITRIECEALKDILGPDYNVTHIIMDGNPGPNNNETQVYALAASLPGPVIQVISRARNGWFVEATNTPSKYWINLRGSPLENELPPNNTIWNIFNEFTIWYIKGFIAAKMSNSSHFVIVIPENFTSVYVNNANAYLAGLKFVNQDAILYLIDTNGNFGGSGNEQLVMNKILQIESTDGVFFHVIAHLQSQRFWPNITEQYGRLLIENQIGVYSPESTFNELIGPGKAHVLVTTEWDHTILMTELILAAIERSLPERRTVYISSNDQGDLVLRLSRLSTLIPASVKHEAKSLQKTFLKKEEINDILCDPQVVNELRSTYFVVNECILNYEIIYRTRISDKIIYHQL